MNSQGITILYNYDPPDASSTAQLEAGKRVIIQNFGKVIGDQQAQNIAYLVLIAVRGAARREEPKDVD